MVGQLKPFIVEAIKEAIGGLPPKPKTGRSSKKPELDEESCNLAEGGKNGVLVSTTSDIKFF